MTEEHQPDEGLPPDGSPSEGSAEEGSFGGVAGEAPDQGEPVEEPVGEPAGAPGPSETPEPTGNPEVATVPLEDLQRVQAEFVNYKRRVERDRQLIEQNATYKVLMPIIDVLDTVDRAREHGDLDPGFQAVADQLERVVTGLGLTKFGQAGDAFDPSLHEALSHIGEDAEVEVTTCKVVAKAGYKFGDRVVRAAQVLVVDPA